MFPLFSLISLLQIDTGDFPAIFSNFLSTLAISRHVGELLCRKCGAHITNQVELLNVTNPESKPKYRSAFIRK